MKPLVTVIICTYNRGDLLTETIPTILRQNISVEYFDVMIVDNNSTDNTQKVIKTFVENNINLSSIKEAQQGVSFARNAGYKKTKTDWVIFLDDDAKTPDNFVETALNIINSNKYNCFGGVYYPWYKYGKPKWFKDRYVSTAEFYNKKDYHKLTYASAGIMAIKRSLLKEFGGFSKNMGPKGDKMSYGEETHLQDRLLKKGNSIGIFPNWYIYHIVNENKLNFSWFLNNGYATGRDFWIIYNEKVSLKLLIGYSKNIIKSIFQNTALLFKENYYIQNWTAETIRTIAFEFGRIISGLKLLAK